VPPSDGDVATTPPPLPDGYRSLIVTGGDLAVQALRLEHDVFVAEDFFPSSASGRIEDYDPFTARSLFHVVTGTDGKVVGMVRSLIGPFGSLPIGDYVSERWDNSPHDPVCEYASLAIHPDERGAGIAEELYRSVFALAWNSGVDGLVALVDPWLRDLLNDFYGCDFEDIGPPVAFSYGEVIPIGMTLSALAVAMPVKAPVFWAWLNTALTSFEVTVEIRDLVLDGTPITERDALDFVRED